MREIGKANTRRSGCFYALCFLSIFFVLVLKDFSVVKSSFLWAEDGTVFLPNVLQFGIQSVFRPYAGYLHVIPHFITWLSVKISLLLGLGIQIAPLGMRFFSLCIASFAVSYFCADSFAWCMPNRVDRLLICIALVVFASAYEVFYTVTNIQWWLGVFPFWVGLGMLHTKSFSASVFQMVVLVLLGFSSPLGVTSVVCFLGLLLFKLLRKEKVSRKDILLCVVIFVPTVIQLVLSRSSENRGPVFLAPVKGLVMLIGNAPGVVIHYLFDYFFARQTLFLKLLQAGLSLAVGLAFWMMLFRVQSKERMPVTIFSVCFVYLNFVLMFLRPIGFGALFYTNRYTVVPHLVMAFFVSRELIYFFNPAKSDKRFAPGVVAVALWLCATSRFVKIDTQFARIYKTASALYAEKGTERIHIKIAPAWPLDVWTFKMPFDKKKLQERCSAGGGVMLICLTILAQTAYVFTVGQ